MYLERYATASLAIAREKQLKRWSRVKKLELLLRVNPGWADLSEEWGKPLTVLELQPADLSTTLRFGRDDE